MLAAPILALPLASAPPPPAGNAPRQVGNLVVDGVPEVPPALAERTLQYQNTRSAVLADWHPRGEGVLVLTRFGDTRQVHFVEAPGGARRQLTFLKEPVAGASFDERRGDGGFLYRADVGGGEFYQYFWFDQATGKSRLVTDGTSRNEGLVWANAGGRFAFSSTRRNGADFDVYVATVNDAATAMPVLERKGQWNAIDWSPGDSKLLLRHYVSAAESSLHVLDLASGQVSELDPRDPSSPKVAYSAAVFARKGDAVFYASDEDSEFKRLVRHDLRTKKKEVLTADIPWDVEDVAVSDDGAWLAFTANEGGASALYLAPAARPKQRAKIDLPPGVILGLDFDPAGRRLGFTLSSAQSPADTYTVDLRTRKVTRWTFSEVGGLDPTTFATPELVQFRSFDGREIPAWYYRPARASGKVPVIISIHGGPEAQSRVSFNPSVQFWIDELGAAVLLPNVRGSSGYGKSYLQLDDGMKRMDSVKDIGALLDWIATRPELDADRVAVIGGSYGGFMVLASMYMYPERLRCGVDIVGISNLVTFLERTESYRRDLRRVEYGDERDPETRKFQLAISPTTNAAKIKRPLFVVQGQNDPRVPAYEAEQIVKVVRANGGSVWYLLARDEGHGFQKKPNQDYLTNAVALFFQEFLLK